MKKRPTKAAKAVSKGKAKPAPAKRRGGPPAACDKPSWDDPEWERKTDAFLWNKFEEQLAAKKNTPEQDEELRKRYREKLSGWVERMVAIRAEKAGKWASTPPPSQAQRQAAEAECVELAAIIEQRDIEQKNPETHRTTQAFGRRALKALVIQYAGYSLAADVAGGDGHLEISLEALAIWLQEGVEVDGERVPRWQTMPAGSFHHLQRKPHKRLRKGRTRTVVKNASEVRLKTAGKEWLWKEFAESAREDREAGMALAHLLGGHKDAAERFVERFLSGRHSVQAGTRERLIETATAMVSGDKDRVAVTTKEDRHRIIQDHPPDNA